MIYVQLLTCCGHRRSESAVWASLMCSVLSAHQFNAVHLLKVTSHTHDFVFFTPRPEPEAIVLHVHPEWQVHREGQWSMDVFLCPPALWCGGPQEFVLVTGTTLGSVQWCPHSLIHTCPRATTHRLHTHTQYMHPHMHPMVTHYVPHLNTEKDHALLFCNGYAKVVTKQ